MDDAAWQTLRRRLGEPGEYPAGHYRGQGIVVAAGGASLFTNAYVLISILRRTLGCRLPIEVWHFGADEMSPTMRALLDELDVELVDAVPKIAASGADIADGWQLKAFSLVHSRFEEVLLLDADQVPTTDPTALFDWPEYRAKGAVFWPDIVTLRRDNPIWNALGLTAPEPAISLESGQMLIDKRLHWTAVVKALVLNEAADLIYRLVYGDKDTFLLAFMLAGADFALVPHIPFRGDRCLFQRDFAGKPLFQHRTNGKWTYAADEQPTEGFQLFDECKAALETLKARWNGRVFNAPDRSPAAREAERVAQGLHRLEVVGEETADIDLLPHGEIGEGRSTYRQNWWCEEREDAVRLLIRDADRVVYDLRRQPDGTWRGERHLHNRAVATLAPIVAAPPIAQDHPGLADVILASMGYPRLTVEDWRRQTEALTLLAAAEPGIRQRLRQIADRDGPSLAGPLTALLDSLEQRLEVGRLRTGLGVLGAGYTQLFVAGDEQA